jgi:hypothetical protein
MRAIVMMGFLAVSALVAAQASADEGTANVPMKRQIILCMSKNMSANKTLSYNDAERECKQNLAARNPIVAAKRALTANAADTPALKNP